MSKHVSGAYGQYGVLKKEKEVPYFSQSASTLFKEKASIKQKILIVKKDKYSALKVIEKPKEEEVNAT